VRERNGSLDSESLGEQRLAQDVKLHSEVASFIHHFPGDDCRMPNRADVVIVGTGLPGCAARLCCKSRVLGFRFWRFWTESAGKAGIKDLAG
jgi:hypothetical protein